MEDEDDAIVGDLAILLVRIAQKWKNVKRPLPVFARPVRTSRGGTLERSAVTIRYLWNLYIFNVISVIAMETCYFLVQTIIVQWDVGEIIFWYKGQRQSLCVPILLLLFIFSNTATTNLLDCELTYIFNFDNSMKYVCISWRHFSWKKGVRRRNFFSAKSQGLSKFIIVWIGDESLDNSKIRMISPFDVFLVSI